MLWSWMRSSLSINLVDLQRAGRMQCPGRSKASGRMLLGGECCHQGQTGTVENK